MTGRYVEFEVQTLSFKEYRGLGRSGAPPNKPFDRMTDRRFLVRCAVPHISVGKSPIDRAALNPTRASENRPV